MISILGLRSKSASNEMKGREKWKDFLAKNLRDITFHHRIHATAQHPHFLPFAVFPTMLPPSSINSIKSNLGNAVSSKSPQAVASAVELPPLHRRTSLSGGASGSQAVGHREQLKIDGADWSPVLNSLLDCHAAISSVGASTYFFCLDWGVMWFMMHFNIYLWAMPIINQKGWNSGIVPLFQMLYNVRGCLTFISMDVHPSDIPCCMPLYSDVDRNPVLQHLNRVKY